MIQTSFIDSPPPIAHNGTPTSLAAAKQIEPHAGTLRANVLAFLRSNPQGATREEIEVALGMAGNTVRPRVSELLMLGLIRETGATRLTRSGRAAAVLEANR